MTTLTWILDLHVDRTKGRPTPFFEEALSRSHVVHGMRDSILPKPIDLTAIAISGPTIVRGSHGFVNYVQRQLDPYPGGFLHATNFQPSTYSVLLGKLCLNHDITFMDYGSLGTNLASHSVFVKPLQAKRFNGVVVLPGRTIEESHTAAFGIWFEPNATDQIAVCRAKAIGKEYRVVVIGRSAVTGSTYDSNGEMAPPNVMEFANHVAGIFNPADAYVVDIAETPDGLAVVEYNQFSTSAIYRCDQRSIATALERLLL